jgi:neocarzinostatin family protein
MQHFARAARLLIASGVLLISAAIGLLAFSGTASATATLTVTPSTGLSNGSVVTVSGSGFADSSTGAVLECNSDPGQPTISVAGNAVPVSCTSPFSSLHTTTSGGALAAVSFTIKQGTVGPPATGTDSSGGQASTDAANYPCPPTPAQVTDGDDCTIAFGDQAGDEATVVISFGGVAPTTTTTTEGGTTTTTTSSTTTTTTEAPTTTTTTAAPTGPNITVVPNTGLVSGTVVSVSGSLFDDNATGGLLECSTATGQPTISVAGNDVPVSCTNPLLNLATTTASGDLAAKTFTITEGTVGPPATGTDSGGGNAATDAASYPCPPTAAQVAAGATCEMTFGDSGGASASAPITFASQTTTTTTVISGQTTGTTTSGGTTKTVLPDGTLAFTGAGPGVWFLAITGLILLDIGFLLMTTYYRPRDLIVIAGRRAGRILGGR